MRGKVIDTQRKKWCVRITPAYAGKSRICWKKSRGIWDHPRLCGEKSNNFPIVFAFSGSPPPMRGKVQAFSGKMLHIGITPAYAGKRKSRIILCKKVWDHPRLCGEKKQRTGRCAGSIRITPAYAGKSIFDCVISTCKMGSPPPMRGKVTVIPSRACTCRITPAYAGKSY